MEFCPKHLKIISWKVSGRSRFRSKRFSSRVCFLRQGNTGFFSRQNLAETREDYIAIEVHREFLFETQPDIGRLEPFIAWA